MQGAYGGLIVIIMYAGAEAALNDESFLITQSNLDIMTQSSDRILVTGAI